MAGPGTQVRAFRETVYLSGEPRCKDAIRHG